jgi:hypothetical protein
MSGKTPSLIYKFDETQRRPTQDVQLQKLFHKNSLVGTDNLLNEVRDITQTQKEIGQRLSLLTDVCDKIMEHVVVVKEKLSQYDIDGDEISNVEESDDENDEMEENG